MKTNKQSTLENFLEKRLDNKVTDKAIFNISEDIIINIPINNVIIDKQIRENFNENDIKSLANSIKKIGLINPISVIKIDDNKYKLVAGERRLRAVKLLNWDKIKARILKKDIDITSVQLIENLQREDLSPYEKAKGLYEYFIKIVPEKNIDNLLNLLINYKFQKNTEIFRCLDNINKNFNISIDIFILYLFILQLPEKIQCYFKNKPYLPYYTAKIIYSTLKYKNIDEILPLLDSFKNNKINITQLINSFNKMKPKKTINKKEIKEKRLYSNFSSFTKKIINIEKEIKEKNIKIKDKKKVLEEIEKIEEKLKHLKSILL